MQCQCGQVLGVKEEFAGKMVKCPKCQTALRVPQPQEAGARAAGARAAGAAAGGGQALGGGLDDLFDDIGLKSAKDRVPTCPGCKAAVQPNAVLCVNCGFDFRTGEMRRSVGSIADNLSLKSDAERRVARAAKNINQSEIQNNSDSFGDAGSIWSWLMPFALPFLLLFSVGVAVYWAMRLAWFSKFYLYPAIFELGWYEMIFPILLFGIATSLFYTSWWNTSLHCIQVNVWLGMLSLGTLGIFTPWFGMPFWKDLRFNMILYAVGLNIFVASGLFAFDFWLFRIERIGWYAFLFLIPFTIFYVGFVVNYVYWMRLTVIAFSEGMLQGLLAMFTYLYAPIYGIVRWQYCKWETSFWLGSFAVMGIGIVMTILFSVLIVALPTSAAEFSPTP